jgi:hypothetical protein
MDKDNVAVAIMVLGIKVIVELAKAYVILHFAIKYW